MKPLVEEIKNWGKNQSPRPIRSALLFIPVLVLAGVLIVGSTILLLQLFDFMPKQSTFSWKTLIGSTILFGALIVTTFVSANTWAKWLGLQGLEFIGLSNHYHKFLIGILWGIGLQLFIFAVLIASGWLQVVSGNFESQSVINVLIITVSSLNAGVVEEIVYRGVIYSSLRRKWNWTATAIITATLFALPHFILSSYDFPIIAGLGLFVGGFLFAWAREVTQTLWIPIGIHFAWDTSIGWFNLTASKSPHVLVTSINAPNWVVGEWAMSDWLLLLAFALTIWLVSLRQKTG